MPDDEQEETRGWLLMQAVHNFNQIAPPAARYSLNLPFFFEAIFVIIR